MEIPLTTAWTDVPVLVKYILRARSGDAINLTSVMQSTSCWTISDLKPVSFRLEAKVRSLPRWLHGQCQHATMQCRTQK